MNSNWITVYIVGTTLVRLACVAGSIWMAIAGKEGWGWPLLAAILIYPSFSSRRENEKEEDE